jgi:hypothetical protein
MAPDQQIQVSPYILQQWFWAHLRGSALPSFIHAFSQKSIDRVIAF